MKYSGLLNKTVTKLIDIILRNIILLNSIFCKILIDMHFAVIILQSYLRMCIQDKKCKLKTRK